MGSKKDASYRAWVDEGNEMTGIAVSDQKTLEIDLRQNLYVSPSNVSNDDDDRQEWTMIDNVGDSKDKVKSGESNDKELLKALGSVKEAEKKAESLAKERDSLSNALVEEVMQSFGYRQQANLLELQVSALQWQCQQQEQKRCCGVRRSKGASKGNNKGQ